ncbi:phytanoyl-CoA dioxygenase family protein [Paenibacillus sp. MBLB4367]|uniref:phytanoyl-CoA dioxygenase family protein n=1 Tax=Paenibacillus sp. MBLB4367 TaxID=3384767 RepID=UPI003907E7CB
MKPNLLPYPYEFDQDRLQDIRECKERHGFAIVKQLFSKEHVEGLKEEVRRVLGPQFANESILSITDIAFIEKSPVMAELLAYEPLMRIANYLNDGQPMTLNRSAAIYKKPGAGGDVGNSGVHAWHTDWNAMEHPYGANAVLNNSGAASLWFYLTGSHPHNGGLAILPDSHTDDWTGPEGFAFTEGRKSFYRMGTEPKPCCDMDVPGMIPVISEPGDLVIFAERTYHGVNAHKGTEPRLSCGMSFRSSSYNPGPIWPLPESARRFIESCPAESKHLVEGYSGIDTSWRSAP